jgi:small subunit ribosomal protein S3
MIERKFIQKNFDKMELEQYLEKKLERAGFDKLEIIKTPMVTRIVLYVAKPGLAIGKSGSTIKTLTEVISQKHKIDNPQIEIQEINDQRLNAKIQAKKMAQMIERGFSWRSVAYRLIKDAMNAGAQGIELVVKGKLSGKGGRKRKQRIALGYMKKIGHQAKMVDFAKEAAYPKAGAIGIRLRIIHPRVVFPDKIDAEKVIKEMKQTKQEMKEQLEKELPLDKEEKIEAKKLVKEKIIQTVENKIEEKKEEKKTTETKTEKEKTEKKEDKKEVKKENEEKQENKKEIEEKKEDKNKKN